MNTTAIRIACAAAVLLVGGVATAQQTTPRLTIAAAGSPLIVPSTYVEGILTRRDVAGGTIVVDGITYPVLDTKVLNNISVGERVIITVLIEHYGRAARKVALGLERAGHETD